MHNVNIFLFTSYLLSHITVDLHCMMLTMILHLIIITKLKIYIANIHKYINKIIFIDVYKIKIFLYFIKSSKLYIFNWVVVE